LSTPTLILINGLALGLASTLHCAGMCGAISASLALCQPTTHARSFGSGFVLAHGGRVTAYVIAGAVVGAAGAPAIAWLDREVAYRLLQWAGACAVMWIGLSIAGLMPSFARLDRYMLALAGGVTRLSTGFGAHPSGPYLAGLAWGLMPCGMVYGALFTAMLTGSAAGGGLTMLAFGIGTVPALLATTFGMKSIRDFATRGIGKSVAGLTIALLGFFSVFVVNPSGGFLCLNPLSTQANSNDSLGHGINDPRRP
jgi:sulfite exporter TauE/SafE